MMDGLFELPDGMVEPAGDLSADRRRTLRQAATLAAGYHPLGGRLHQQAAPVGDPKAAGRRCGNCRHRELIHTNGNRRWPKCLLGAVNPTDTQPHPIPPRVTRGAATDCRATWPACTDHVWADPKVSGDAARWVPETEEGPAS